MRERLRSLWRDGEVLVRRVTGSAHEHNVPMMAAALSYYLLVTLVPLVALLTAVLARAGIQRASMLDQVNAADLSATLDTWVGRNSTLTYLVIAVIVLYGASSVFSQYVNALGRIWGEPSERSTLYEFARRHLLGFALLGVLAVGLAASMFVGAVIAAATEQLLEATAQLGLPTDALSFIPWSRIAVDLGASFILFTTSFSLVPNRKLRLREVAPGAFVTACAYALGQIALSYYLSTTSRIDMAGVLGQAIALLLWVYYSAMIALYGAELTRAIILRKEQRAGDAPIQADA